MPLYWKDRPESVTTRIDQAYENIAKNTSSSWGLYNGRNLYWLARVNDHLLLEKIILKRLKQEEKPHIVLMDMGAGNFQWGESIVKFINNHPLYCSTVKVSIISVRGEQNNEPEVITDGVCNHFRYGNFKVENLVEELESRGHRLTNQIDGFFSHACFRHLVDGAGTLLQAHHLLRPEIGLLCIEGFYLDTSICSYDTDNQRNLLSLFKSFNNPFFREDTKEKPQFSNFVMQKSADFSIPLVYQDVVKCNDRGIGADYVTHFSAPAEWSVEMSEVKEHNANATTYSTLTEAGAALLNEIAINHTDIIEIKKQKVFELLNQAENKDLALINRLLQDLIELEASEALECINSMLSKNHEFALDILNFIPQENLSLLGTVICRPVSAAISTLLDTLIKIATPDVLNAQYNGSTPIMIATHQAIVLKRIDLLQRLLECPDVDLNVRSSNDGRTVLNMVSEERQLQDNENIRSIEALLKSLTRKNHQPQNKKYLSSDDISVQYGLKHNSMFQSKTNDRTHHKRSSSMPVYQTGRSGPTKSQP